MVQGRSASKPSIAGTVMVLCNCYKSQQDSVEDGVHKRKMSPGIQASGRMVRHTKDLAQLGDVGNSKVPREWKRHVRPGRVVHLACPKSA